MEAKDRSESGGSAASSESPSDASQQQQKNSVLELSFKTRRHFVYCTKANSPKQNPFVGSGQSVRTGQKPDFLQDTMVSQVEEVSVSSTSIFHDDHDYSSSAKRGRGLETGRSTLPVLQPLIKQSVVYNGLDSNHSQVSKMSPESFEEDFQLSHPNPMSDLMQAMCEEVIQAERDVAGVWGDEINRPSAADTQSICDTENCGSHSNLKTTEASKFLVPSAFTVKIQKQEASKDPRTTESTSSTQVKNHILRATWSSSSSNNQSSTGRTSRSMNSTYADCESPVGVNVGASTSKHQIFKVDIGSSIHSKTTPLLSERPTSGSLDSTQTGMMLPSPFLIQTGLEKTLDFAEFRPMSPSSKDWSDEFCCSHENGLDTALFENEMAKTCDMSGVSPFDGQDFPIHQGFFSSPSTSSSCVRMQQSGLYVAPDIKTSIARTKQNGIKWTGGKRQERLKVNFEPYPLTLEDLQVLRRDPFKQQLECGGAAVEISEETVGDLYQKKARRQHTLSLNRMLQEEQEPVGADLILGSADELKTSRRPRKPKKLRDVERYGKGEFDHRRDTFEKMDSRPCKKFRFKPELQMNEKHRDKNGNVADQSTDPRSTEQDRPPRGTGTIDEGSTQQRVPAAFKSVDFCDVLSTMLDRWLEYLMTPQDVMRRQAIDDARSFGYNDDALDMVSNGDLEVWRILDDMEPDFVRSGFEKYFT